MGTQTQQTIENRQEIIEMLNHDLANEVNAVLQYLQHEWLGEGIEYPHVTKLFDELSLTEMRHMEMLAERIIALDGVPYAVTDVGNISKYATYHVESPPKDYSDLQAMIKADMENERIAIRAYTEQIREIGLSDPVTREMLEEILADEQEHEEELENLTQ